MKVTINIPNDIVQSYLKNFNGKNDTDLKVDKLTDEQTAILQEGFKGVAEGEIEMRTDDHSGFETHDYFPGL